MFNTTPYCSDTTLVYNLLDTSTSAEVLTPPFTRINDILTVETSDPSLASAYSLNFTAYIAQQPETVAYSEFIANIYKQCSSQTITILNNNDDVKIKHYIDEQQEIDLKTYFISSDDVCDRSYTLVYT